MRGLERLELLICIGLLREVKNLMAAHLGKAGEEEGVGFFGECRHEGFDVGLQGGDGVDSVGDERFLECLNALWKTEGCHLFDGGMRGNAFGDRCNGFGV